jgi:hypothetical protein
MQNVEGSSPLSRFHAVPMAGDRTGVASLLQVS